MNHLYVRYQAVEKSIQNQLSKLRELQKKRDQYYENARNLDSWITSAEEKLKIYEEISGPKAITFYQSRLKELKTFNEEKEQGHAIFNVTTEAGEALYSKLNPDDREAIRSDLKNLRSRLDNVTDRANIIYKKVENDMMHRSSFEDKFSQVSDIKYSISNEIQQIILIYFFVLGKTMGY